jgi:hypothetical protein
LQFLKLSHQSQHRRPILHPDRRRVVVVVASSEVDSSSSPSLLRCAWQWLKSGTILSVQATSHQDQAVRQFLHPKFNTPVAVFKLSLIKINVVVVLIRSRHHRSRLRMLIIILCCVVRGGELTDLRFGRDYRLFDCSRILSLL